MTISDRKRMIDWLMVDTDWMPIFRPQARGAVEERARYLPLLKSAVCFDIGNVYEYCVRERVYSRYYSDRGIVLSGKADDAELFVCAPQFPTMWMDYSATVAQARDGEGEVVLVGHPDRVKNTQVEVGWLLRSWDCRQEPDAKDAVNQALQEKGYSITSDEVRWIIGATEWCRYNRTPEGQKGSFILGPSYTVLLTVDSHGRLLDRHFAPYWNLDTWNPSEMPKLKKSDWADVFTKWVPVQFALTFMNCRNVRHETVQPSPKLSKAHRKKHGGPGLVEYRHLVLDLGKDAVSREGGEDARGATRLHICRGHFRIYSAEKPLFGRYVGPVWVPAHLRGSASEGILAKDYRLKGAGGKDSE